MTIPVNQQIHVEIKLHGSAASKGSSSVFTTNTFHFRRTSTVNPINYGNVEAAFHTAVATPVAAALNERWLQITNDVRCIDDKTLPSTTVLRTLPGLITGDSLAPHISAFMFFRTNKRGRAFVGKKFFGPMSESDTTAATADLYNAGAVTRLAAIGTAFLAGFTDSDGNIWQAQVLSRKNSNFNVFPATLEINDCIQALVNKRLGRFKKREVLSQY